MVAAVLLPRLLIDPCGPGLTLAGTPQVCVGLDIDSTGFAKDGPLSDLASQLARSNDSVTGAFATIVLLDNMTPDSQQDSDGINSLRHRVQGAMTAVRRANEDVVGGGTEPKIKLLLANYGSRAESWRPAVDAIKKARESQRVTAVTGIGQSLDTTRQAVAALSADGIVTVGSVVTADDMNEDLNGKPIENFVRVAPTNTDEAKAMVSYLVRRGYRKAMLIKDLNESDNYTSTLASGYSSAYEQQVGTRFPYINSYMSPGQHLTGTERDQYMKHRFGKFHDGICQLGPDVIVFAGRSTDLRSFMHALSEGRACPFPSLDVVTGDDGATIAGKPLPASEYLRFQVFYTGLAHGAQWDSAPNSLNRQNYDAFAEKFLKYRFSRDDLTDGHAMMSHDAALTAITTIRDNPQATSDPSTVRDYLLDVRCKHTIPGASGTIALEPNGNPTNKGMPIVQIQPDGSQKQEELAWPLGGPTDPSSLSTCG